MTLKFVLKESKLKPNCAAFNIDNFTKFLDFHTQQICKDSRIGESFFVYKLLLLKFLLTRIFKSIKFISIF